MSDRTLLTVSYKEIPRPPLPALPRWGTAETAVLGRWKYETPGVVSDLFSLSKML